MTRAIQSRVDTWVCRDTEHVLHLAKMSRYFNDGSKLIKIYTTLACYPRTISTIPARGDWFGRKLPPVTYPGPFNDGFIMLVEYDVREAPTCVKCAVARPL